MKRRLNAVAAVGLILAVLASGTAFLPRRRDRRPRAVTGRHRMGGQVPGDL